MLIFPLTYSRHWLNALQILLHLTLKTLIKGFYYYLHFIDEKTVTRRDDVAPVGSTGSAPSAGKGPVRSSVRCSTALGPLPWKMLAQFRLQNRLPPPLLCHPPPPLPFPWGWQGCASAPKGCCPLALRACWGTSLGQPSPMACPAEPQAPPVCARELKLPASPGPCHSVSLSLTLPPEGRHHMACSWVSPSSSFKTSDSYLSLYLMAGADPFSRKVFVCLC